MELTDAQLREWHRRMAAIKSAPIPAHLDPVLNKPKDQQPQEARP